MGTTVNYGTASSYVKVASGSATLGVEAAGTTSLLLSESITLSSGILLYDSCRQLFFLD
jgi:hypothetical protein